MPLNNYLSDLEIVGQLYQNYLKANLLVRKEIIKKQYYVLAKKWHPDKNKHSAAEERFRRIKAAYESLSEFEEPYRGEPAEPRRRPAHNIWNTPEYSTILRQLSGNLGNKLCAYGGIAQLFEMGYLNIDQLKELDTYAQQSEHHAKLLDALDDSSDTVHDLFERWSIYQEKERARSFPSALWVIPPIPPGMTLAEAKDLFLPENTQILQKFNAPGNLRDLLLYDYISFWQWRKYQKYPLSPAQEQVLPKLKKYSNLRCLLFEGHISFEQWLVHQAYPYVESYGFNEFCRAVRYSLWRLAMKRAFIENALVFFAAYPEMLNVFKDAFYRKIIKGFGKWNADFDMSCLLQYVLPGLPYSSFELSKAVLKHYISVACAHQGYAILMKDALLLDDLTGIIDSKKAFDSLPDILQECVQQYSVFYESSFYKHFKTTVLDKIDAEIGTLKQQANAEARINQLECVKTKLVTSVYHQFNILLVEKKCKKQPVQQQLLYGSMKKTVVDILRQESRNSAIQAWRNPLADFFRALLGAFLSVPTLGIINFSESYRFYFYHSKESQMLRCCKDEAKSLSCDAPAMAAEGCLDRNK